MPQMPQRQDDAGNGLTVERRLAMLESQVIQLQTQMLLLVQALEDEAEDDEQGDGDLDGNPVRRCGTDSTF